MPELPPVTTAIFPSSFPISSTPLVGIALIGHKPFHQIWAVALIRRAGRWGVLTDARHRCDRREGKIYWTMVSSIIKRRLGLLARTPRWSEIPACRGAARSGWRRKPALNRLTHGREETRHSSGVALNYRGKLGALGERHTYAVDADIADLVAPVAYHQPPINLDRRSLRTNDLARHDHA